MSQLCNRCDGRIHLHEFRESKPAYMRQPSLLKLTAEMKQVVDWP